MFFCCFLLTEVNAQIRPTKDERAEKQAVPPANTTMTEQQKPKLMGYFPLEVNSTEYGIIKVRVQNNSDSKLQLNSTQKIIKVSFGVVQTNVTPLKFIKCIEITDPNSMKESCWIWSSAPYLDILPAKSQWFNVSYSIGFYDKAPDLYKLFDYINYNWGKYLNGLPEKDKKYMRLGVKVEVEGASKDLVTTLNTGFSSNVGKDYYFPAEVASDKYGVLRVRIDNPGQKPVPKSIAINVRLMVLVAEYNELRELGCAGGTLYKSITIDGINFTSPYTECITLTFHVIVPIEPGKSGWTIANFMPRSDALARAREAFDKILNNEKDPDRKLKRFGVKITVEGAAKELVTTVDSFRFLVPSKTF